MKYKSDDKKIMFFPENKFDGFRLGQCFGGEKNISHTLNVNVESGELNFIEVGIEEMFNALEREFNE